jgi:hypothetical protein
MTKTPDVLVFMESFLKQNNHDSKNFSFDYIDTILDFFGRFFTFECVDKTIFEFLSDGFLETL